jgi:hypothetical protein
MKALITLALVFGIYWFGKSIFEQAKVKQAKEEAAQRGDPVKPADGLEGMPANFEPSLQAAIVQGAPALKAWIDRYRPHIRDPKLAAIELDYVVLVSRSNPAEAKRAFQAVKARVPPSSPIYERVKRLDATYGR